MQAPPTPKSPLGYYRLLSPTAGVRVSPLCLGTMNFGIKWGAMLGECDKTDTFKILDHFYENGGNFLDTANAYHGGESEEYLGEWMKERGNREELVIATKYTGAKLPPGAKIGVNYSGNHIKNLIFSLEGSLKRLQTSYVDVLYMHWWDFTASVPEVMLALNRLVDAGKVHYLGLSDAPAWIALKANLYAQQHGLAQFSVYQGQYNAAVRDCEREIMPVCEDTGMGFLPYGSQGGGSFITKAQQEARGGAVRKIPMYKQDQRYESVTVVLDEIAQNRGSKIPQVALAWTLLRAPYVLPIIGARKLEYLEDAIKALKLDLSEDECDRIARASNFEIGFPMSFTIQHYDQDILYKPSMTSGNMPLTQMYGPLDIVEKARPIPFHTK